MRYVPALAVCLVIAAAAPARAQVIAPGHSQAHLEKVKRAGKWSVVLGAVAAVAGAWLAWYGAGHCERTDDEDDCELGELAGVLLGGSLGVAGAGGVIVGGVLWHEAGRELRGRGNAGEEPLGGWYGAATLTVRF